jgi:hypothetical protein
MSGPFAIYPANTFKWGAGWWDAGRGGADYGYYYPHVPPPGFAFIGDGMGRCGGWCSPSDPVLCVVNNRPDVAKPCTGYSLQYTLPWGSGAAGLYLPYCDDPDYIGVCLVVGRPNGGSFVPQPPIGVYYCINKAYLKVSGTASKMDDGNCSKDGPQMYNPFSDCGQFAIAQTQYERLSDNDVWAMCSGQAQGHLSPDNPICQNQMKRLCSADDIKVGGKCSSWCEREPEQCDALMVQFCNQHPDSSWCDCILASTRPLFAEEMSKLKPESQMAPKACRTSLCRDKTAGVDAFMLSSDEKDLQHCPTLQYVDQSVTTSGQGNVINVGFNTSEIKQEASNHKFLVFLIIIIAILVIINISDDETINSYEQAQQAQTISVQ